MIPGNVFDSIRNRFEADPDVREVVEESRLWVCRLRTSLTLLLHYGRKYRLDMADDNGHSDVERHELMTSRRYCRTNTSDLVVET